MLSDTLDITFLGTGTSVGVPVIGCRCAVCQSSDPRDKRTRSSIVIRTPQLTLLVDSGPDLREQALRESLSSVDAVLYTHCHVDHVAGFDELRAFCWGKPAPLPLYAQRSTHDVLQRMFSWAFQADNEHSGYVKPDPVEITGTFHLADLTITPIPVDHGAVETIGYVFENEAQKRFAYIPDVKAIPSASRAKLDSLDLLILDALAPKSHPTHLSLPESREISEQLSPKHTLLTHLGHGLGHAATAASLPDNIQPAYDSLVYRI